MGIFDKLFRKKLEKLIKARKDKDPNVRSIAAKALKKIEGRG